MKKNNCLISDVQIFSIKLSMSLRQKLKRLKKPKCPLISEKFLTITQNNLKLRLTIMGDILSRKSKKL